MDRPRLSIIIPMYNEGENVRLTLDSVLSVLRPTGSSFELVCVDDGSTDNTREVLSELTSGIPELRLAGYSANRGRGYALRTGFAAASGEFIVSIDADMSYHPQQILRACRAPRS